MALADHPLQDNSPLWKRGGRGGFVEVAAECIKGCKGGGLWREVVQAGYRLPVLLPGLAAPGLEPAGLDEAGPEDAGFAAAGRAPAGLPAALAAAGLSAAEPVAAGLGPAGLAAAGFLSAGLAAAGFAAAGLAVAGLALAGFADAELPSFSLSIHFGMNLPLTPPPPGFIFCGFA